MNTHCSAEVRRGVLRRIRSPPSWRHRGTSTTFRALLLPAAMQSRPGSLPSGDGWSFEPKYDGFRAVISTERNIRVRSRRGWEMGPLVRSFSTSTDWRPLNPMTFRFRVVPSG